MMKKILIISLFSIIFAQILLAQSNTDLQIKEQISEIIDRMGKATSMEEVDEIANREIAFNFEIESLPYLLDGIKNENPKIKYGCYIGLHQIIFRAFKSQRGLPYKEWDFNSVSKESREMLKEVLQISLDNATHSTIPEIRAISTAMLSLFGGDDVLSILEDCLQDPDLRVRSSAILSLARLGHRPSDREWLKIMTSKEPKTAEELAEFLGYNEFGLHILARRELKELGNKAVPTLLKVASSDKDKEARRQAIEILGDLKAEQAITLLASYLKEETTDDTSLSLQITSVYSLNKIGSKVAIQSLIDNGLKHKSLEIQLKTAELLITEYKESVVPVLLNFTEHEDSNIRLRVARLLLTCKQKEAISVVIELLEKPHYYFTAKELLEKETGQNFGENPQVNTREKLDEYVSKWKDWWEKNKDTFKFLQEIPEPSENSLLNSTPSFSEEDIVYKAMRKLEQNVELIPAAIEKNPNYAERHRGAAEVYNAIGLISKEKAISEYKEAIKLFPKDITYYVGLAMALWYKYKYEYTYEKTDDSAELMNVLELGEKKEPNNAFYDYMWASVYLMQGKEKEGMGKIEDALNKKYLSQHWEVRVKSKIKILEDMGCFTSTELKINVLYGAGGTDEMFGDIIRHLKKLGEDKESKEEMEDAVEIYKKMVRMAEQIRNDAWLMGALYLGNYSADIGYKGLLRCYKKLGITLEQTRAEYKIKSLENRKNKELAVGEQELLLFSTLKGDALDEFLDKIIKNGEMRAVDLQNKN